MLISVDQFTHNLWLQAVQDNIKDERLALSEPDRKAPYSLIVWSLAGMHGESKDILKITYLAANERDQVNGAPTYFDWANYSINLKSIPDDLQNDWPPSIGTMNKYGTRHINGGLMYSKGGWSSHT
ncbi:MAG: hypothetical protein RPR91_12775 [Colwellia sp.]